MSLKFLHIDDEEDFLFLTRLGLQSINSEIEIDSILDAEEGLKLLEKNRYDAIICDYEMNSEVDGLSILNQLRERGDNTPFIVVTGKSREEIVIKALNLGADFYIEKSLDQKVFYAELHHLLLSAISKNHNLEALINSESRYRALAENTAVGFWQIDLEGNIIYLNKAMVNLFGYRDTNQLFDQKLENFIHPLHFLDIKSNSKPKTYESTLLNKSGKKIFGILSIAPVYDANNTLESFIGTFTDINDLRLAEQALIESQEQLKREKEELSSFAHMISHDIRNMLSSIHGYASLLNPDSEDGEIVENIKTVTNKAFQFLNRSLELAEAGLIVEKGDKVNFKSILNETIEMVIPKRITTSVTGELPNIIGDSQKIYQVFKNLLENAVVHGNPTSIAIKLEKKTQNGLITISNNGKQITETTKKRLFTDKQKGLGFKIIKKIVDAHGWEIKVLDSKETTFQIKIPL